MRLSLAITDFLLSRDGSPKTLDWYDEKLQLFCRFAQEQGVAETDGLTAALCQAFLRTVRARPGHLGRGTVSTQTVHGYARTLRALLNYGVKAGWVDARQPKLLSMPKRESRLIQVFSPRQLEALRVACEHRPTALMRARDSAVVNTLVDTGIRAGELLGLTEDHLHLSHRDSYLSVIGKGNKEREVGPLGKRCQSALLRYLPYRSENAHVFQTDDGHPLRMAGLDDALKWLRDESGVTGVRVSAHTFRHTYAVAYLSQPGADIYKLRHLMGHTTVSTTELYLRDFQARDARRGFSVGDTYR